MRIITSDGNKYINIGAAEVWKSLCSTIFVLLDDEKDSIMKARSFLENNKAEGVEGYEIARQFNLIRDKLSRFAPEKVIFDINDMDFRAPWYGKLSPVVTSCANLFITADGEDLLYEIVCIFCYAEIKRVSVLVE